MKTRNKVKYISLIIFAILTLILTLTRVPFWDEARAFIISQLPFLQIFQMTRIDGHPIIWYLILKFFTSLKTYPFSMFIINWILCIFALKILWDCAPFKTLVKVFITFSNIFYFYFGIVSRGYSLVLIFLFLICAMYKKRFKNPYLFSFLIILCANCELVGAIFAFCVGIIYLFELYKKYSSKTLFYRVFLIFSFGALLFLAQMMNFGDYNLLNIYNKPSFRIIYDCIFYSNLKFYYILIFIIFICLLLFNLFNKNKKLFLITFGVFSIFSFVLCKVYFGSFWNHHFFYVYLILIAWLNYKTIIKNKVLNILFLIILLYNLPINDGYKYSNIEMVYLSDSYKIAKKIIDNPKYKNAKLYTIDDWSEVSPGADVYLMKNNINLYHIDGTYKNSFENIKNIYKYSNKKTTLEDIYLTFDKKRDNYLLSSKEKSLENIIPSKNYYLKMIDFFEKEQLVIYTISKN